MMHPVALPQNATRPIVRQLGATQRGDYTLSCLTDCGYGHAYMEIDGGIVIR
jgi:heme/copper-type cytochrome/quinol oxidase subunit 2